MKEPKNNRRDFIRKAGLGAASVVVPGVAARTFATERVDANGIPAGRKAIMDRSIVVLSNKIQLELCTEGDLFLGIGKVVANEVALRDNTHTLFCEIRSPDGIRVIAYRIVQKEISPDKITLRMEARTEKTPIMDYMLHSVRNRENLYGWSEGPVDNGDTTVIMEILPVQKKMGDYLFSGFSYRYSFESSRFGIYKMLDRGTWEIGGSAIGNESWMRVGHVPSIVRFDRPEQDYSTENYMEGIANPNIFQFLPLQTELQGFTFQAHEKGILVTTATKVAHVRTLLEKPRNKDHVFHFHQHCNDLSNGFETSPVEVLWLDAPRTDRTERYNVYETVRSVIHRDLHEQAGIRQEWISTYGQIEQWDEPDFDKYTDEILPAFAAKGIKRIFIPNEFQNVMNTWGLSNMCCNVDFKFSGTVGEEKIRRFCKAAKQAGMIVDMWGNTAISTTTEMFQWHDGRPKGIQFLPEKDSIMQVLKRSKDPFVRNPSNAIEGDHYTPRFAVLNIRDRDIMDYWMKCWAAAYDAGITGIFLDSSFNMTSDKFHFIQNAEREGHGGNGLPVGSPDDQRFYRPETPRASAILTQYPAHLQLIKGMQELGYSYCGEDLGVFGVHRHGPDVDMLLDSMPIWRESIIDFDEKMAVKAGLDPMHVFFTGLAYRIIWSLKWNFNTQSLDMGIKDPAAYDLLQAFNAVDEYMRERLILPGGKAVRYRKEKDAAASVFWVMEATTLQLPRKRKIWDVLKKRSFYASTWEALAHSVYLVS